MPQPNNEPSLSGQQMSALQKQMQEKVIGIIRDIDLRKWAVNQACSLAGAAMEHESDHIDAVKMAREIHRFLTEGAAEAKT